MNGWWSKLLLAAIVIVTLQIYGVTMALAATRGPTPMGPSTAMDNNNGPVLLTTAWNANVGDESMNLLTSSGPPVFPDGDAQVNEFNGNESTSLLTSSGPPIVKHGDALGNELNDEYAARLSCASIATCSKSAAAAMMSTSPPGTSSLCPSASCVACYVYQVTNYDEQSVRSTNARSDPAAITINMSGESPTKFQQVDATQHQLAKL
jgi:hypothetical protein